MSAVQGRQGRDRLLKDALDRLYASFNYPDSARDPIQIVRRYTRLDDREVVAFIAAGLAFGRVASVMESVERVCAALGGQPAAFVRDFDPSRHAGDLRLIGHRWTRGEDLVGLIWSLRQLIERDGSLEQSFAAGLDPNAPDVEPALEAFSQRARAIDLRPAYGRKPRQPGAHYFFSRPSTGSACKRLNLFLRWMIREDAIDPGGWTSVPARQLVVPLDTHTIRVGKCLGLTRRVSPGWKMASEITTALREFDPDDPVRYDFALCHLSMMGACGYEMTKGDRDCPLRGHCGCGKSKVRSQNRETMALMVTVRTIRRTLVALAAIAIACAWGDARPGAAAIQTTPALRTLTPFDSGWRFSRTDTGSAAMPAFNDSSWRVVDVPHDWSAEGPFTADQPSGNGYAPGGIGWYRKHFILGADVAAKVAALEFDGVYDHAEVFVNGHLACTRAYGYSSFDCPISPYAKYSADNVVAVRVDHSRAADSRWYTGSGIYRHVRLRITDPVRIGQWGTYITTPLVSNDSATVTVETTIENATTRERTVRIQSEILFGNDVIASASGQRDLPAPAGGNVRVRYNQTVRNPRRWTPDAPAMYTLRQRVVENGTVLDEVQTPFGIRTTHFDADKGFFLNEQPLKIKGVCLHHEAGSLGAAVPGAVWERRLRALKALGVNAIRTSHNPPAPEFLDLCDRLGLLVKDEAFDEFTPAKNKWVAGWNAGVPSRLGYAESFAQWAVTDARDMVRRDRNHPSIIMWSVGNEVDYPNDPFSHPVLGRSYRPENPRAENLVTHAKPLVDAIRQLDPTRPITMALASVQMSDAVGLPALLDVVGYNYQETRYADDHAKNPKRVIFGSENNHQFNNWTIVRDNPYVAGQFLWTGIDYLGEAGVFPNRANGAGLLDLAGYKKPMAWFRQSLWSAAPMVYLAASPAAAPAAPGAPRRAVRLEESWNWPAGSTVTVSAYTNAEEVVLTLNDRVVGTQPATAAVDGVLRWDVPFATGELRAVARTNGKTVAEFVLKTAGPAARIELVADTSTPISAADGVAHIEYRIVDRAGNRVPDANTEITFDFQGPGRLLGIGNGDLNDPAAGTGAVHRAYQGRGLAIVQAAGPSGTLTLRASAPGLESDTVAISFPIRNR